jgi:hypothetical protein
LAQEFGQFGEADLPLVLRPTDPGVGTQIVDRRCVVIVSALA